MKKNLTLLLLLIISTVLTLVACKKDYQEKRAVIQGDNKEVLKSESQLSLSISSYGFLQFSNAEELEEYRNFLMNNTHYEVQDYLNTIGFNSYGAAIYEEEYHNELVTEEQTMDYVLNENLIFEVDYIVMRPISPTSYDWKYEFLLAMVRGNLNSSNHTSLVTGTYDSTSMNKFSTNPASQTDPLVEFMRETPFGYEETIASGGPENGKRWFGWGCVTPPKVASDENCIWQECQARFYILKIAFSEEKPYAFDKVCL